MFNIVQHTTLFLTLLLYIYIFILNLNLIISQINCIIDLIFNVFSILYFKVIFLIYHSHIYIFLITKSFFYKTKIRNKFFKK